LIRLVSTDFCYLAISCTPCLLSNDQRIKLLEELELLELEELRFGQVPRLVLLDDDDEE